jgi:hypothetical protein
MTCTHLCQVLKTAEFLRREDVSPTPNIEHAGPGPSPHQNIKF